MKRKTILTSAILALLAVGQGHADNSFVVKDGSYNIVVFLTICISYANNCFTL